MSTSSSVSPKLLRVMDANNNRIGEGLRFLEEVARLILNDAALSQQLKKLRHELVQTDWPTQKQFLQARDSEGDVGASMEVPGEEAKRDLSAAVVANARRVQESLRVMEEMAKLPGVNLSSQKLGQARFALYTLEKALVSRLLRRDKLAKLPGLYVVIDMQFLKGRDYLDAAGKAIQGGATAIQLRDKLASQRELLPVARALKELCADKGALFIINDSLDLALAADADGLHLGQDDLPADVARRLLPIDKVLGISACTEEQAAEAAAGGADYIAVGSIYPTSSKDIEVVGLDRLRRLRQAVTLPLVAIGGINKDNIDEVVAAGADSAAVISAVLGAPDIALAARRIAERIKA